MNIKEKILDFLFLDTGNKFVDALSATCILIGCVLSIMFFVSFLLSSRLAILAIIIFLVTYAVFYFIAINK